MTEMRIESNRLSQDLDRLMVLLRALIRLAEMKVGIGALRLNPCSLLEQGNRQRPLSFDRIDHAEIVVGEKLVRMSSKLYLELSRRVAEHGRAILQQVSQADIIMNARMTIIE